MIKMPEIWNFCLSKIYDQNHYVEGMIKLFNSLKIDECSRILDAGCGIGFPGINLALKGYNIVGVDNNLEMFEECIEKSRRCKAKIDFINIEWSKLSSIYKTDFDCIYCRGNSLAYANSWSKESFESSESFNEIKLSLKNFYDILKDGGGLYIDVLKASEIPHEKALGVLKSKNGSYEITWDVAHNLSGKVRKWTITAKSLESGDIHRHESFSYLINPLEVKSLLKEVGFNTVTKLEIEGETNYDGYLAVKKN